MYACSPPHTHAGAGAPGDATQVLEALLAVNGGGSSGGIRGGGANAAVMIYDPAVAKICTGAGVGAELQVRVGGKSGVVAGRSVNNTAMSSGALRRGAPSAVSAPVTRRHSANSSMHADSVCSMLTMVLSCRF